jgi:hypothetical protein
MIRDCGPAYYGYGCRLPDDVFAFTEIPFDFFLFLLNDFCDLIGLAFDFFN